MENTTKRVRRYLPPETIVLDVSNQEIRSLFDRLNDTPRKCLEFHTPKEIFSRHLLALERQCVWFSKQRCIQSGTSADFTVFRTTLSKSRLNFLSLLRGNYQDYVLNDAAFDYLDQRHSTDPALVVGLRTRTPQHFCNEVPFLHYLASKGIDIFDKEAIRPLAEAGIWGAIRHHGLIGKAVIVSDDAGQFRVGTHALCWVHSERLLQKLMPATPGQVRQVGSSGI